MRKIKFRIRYRGTIEGYEYLDSQQNWKYHSVELDCDEFGNLLREHNGTFPALGDKFAYIREQFIGELASKKFEIYEGDEVKWLDDYPICPKCKNEDSEKLNITLKFCPECGTKIKRQNFFKKGTVTFSEQRWNFAEIQHSDIMDDWIMLYAINQAILKTTVIL